MDLPKLSSTPKHHPDACLSLSTTLIKKLLDLISSVSKARHDRTIALSIGSGTGLLEALLDQAAMTFRLSISIEGVEVQPSVNKYLVEELSHTAKWTWDLCSRAKDASVWLFVYPRSPRLMRSYIETLGSGNQGEAVKMIVWLGPRADWVDFEASFGARFDVEVMEYCGLAAYEMMAVMRVCND